MMVILISNVVIIAAITVAIIAYKYYTKPEAISFKTAMELLELPVITFYVGDKKLHFLLDTGSNKSIINTKVLNFIPYEDTHEKSKLFGLEGNVQETSYVNIDLLYNDKSFPTKFQSVDMSNAFRTIKKENGVTLHGILGTEFFNNYKYVIDFNELIAYSKK